MGPLGSVEVGVREILRALVQVELPLWSDPARDAQRRLAVPERQVFDLEPPLVPVQRQARLAGIEPFPPEREIAELQRGRPQRRGGGPPHLNHPPHAPPHLPRYRDPPPPRHRSG